MRRQLDELDSNSDQVSASADPSTAPSSSGTFTTPHILPDRINEINTARHRSHLEYMCRMLELKDGTNFQPRENELVGTLMNFVVGGHSAAVSSTGGKHSRSGEPSEQSAVFWSPYSAMASMNGAIQVPMYSYYNPSLGLYAMQSRNLMEMPRIDGNVQGLLASSFALQQHLYQTSMNGTSTMLSEQGSGAVQIMRPFPPFVPIQANLPPAPNAQSDDNDQDVGPPRKVSKPSVVK